MKFHIKPPLSFYDSGVSCCCKGVVRIASLKDALRKLMNTSSFKKAVQDTADKAQNSNSGPAAVAMKQNAEYYAAQMQEIIREKMNEHQMRFGTRLGDDYGDMSVYVDRSSNGNFVVGLSFDKDSNLSPSLNEYKWGSVVLPRLLNTGYSAKRTMRGTWEKHGIEGKFSMREREGLDFLEDAVAEFNRRFQGEAVAEWDQLMSRSYDDAY